MLTKNGKTFIGMPNFDIKPDDIIVHDHLTKLNPLSLDMIYKKLKLKIKKRC